MPNRLLPRRSLVDGFKWQRDFDEFFLHRRNFSIHDSVFFRCFTNVLTPSIVGHILTRMS